MVLVEISVVEVSGSVVGVSSVEEAKEDVTSVDVKVDTCSDETEEDSVKSVGSVVLSVTELGEDDDDDSANIRIMKTYCIITEPIFLLNGSSSVSYHNLILLLAFARVKNSLHKKPLHKYLKKIEIAYLRYYINLLVSCSFCQSSRVLSIQF